MTITRSVVYLILAVGIGFGAGFYFKDKINPPVIEKETIVATQKTQETKTAETVTETAATASESQIESCLKAKWGETKYQTIKANPNFATVGDKLASLPCYK